MHDVLNGVWSAAVLYFGYRLFPWSKAPRRLGDDRPVGPPYTHDVRRGYRLLRNLRRR